MSTLEITLQHPRNDLYPVTAELRQSGELSQRREAGFAFGEAERRALLDLEYDPSAYGVYLGGLLFRDGVRDLFMQARARHGEGESLHLLLVVESDELRPLRWERLGIPADGGWSAAMLDATVLFSRYLPSLADRRFPLIGRPDLKTLVVIADPPEENDYNLARFDGDSVARGLDEALGAELLHHHLPIAEINALVSELGQGDYTLLHIVAHGWYRPPQDTKPGETILYLLDDQGQIAPITGTRFIERLRGLKRLPHLIFLSTCDSAKAESEGANALGGLAHRLIKELGVPAVVAMGDKVSTVTANALAEGFYRRLREHGLPDRALEEAAVPLADRGDILIPALYSRLGGRPLFSDAADRPLTPNEIRHALDRLKEQLPERAPVRLEDFNRLADRLDPEADPAHLSAAAREERQETLESLNALAEECLGLDLVGLARSQAPEPYDSRCPFPGLYAFTTNEKEFYFGREPLSAELAERLNQHPFLAILGVSGSGKSSLVLAGIVPLLCEREPGLDLRYLKPGNTPLATLESLLDDRAGEPPGQRGRHAAAQGSAVPSGTDALPGTGSWPSMAGMTVNPQPDGSPRLIVIDQFEELFTLCDDLGEQQAFVERLLGLTTPEGARTNDPASVSSVTRIILTMRADFWGECAPFPALREAMEAHQKLIPPMGSAELRSAMEQQAQQTGLRFEADLSHTILAEVENEPGTMPLLQHLLQELWRRRHGRWLKSAEYHDLGGIRQAIAHTADGFYQTLDSDQQEQCRNIFIRLTRLGEGDQGEHRDTRHRVSLDQLVPAGSDTAQIKALAARLADTRLMMVSADHIEVAHEALIQHWQRLRVTGSTKSASPSPCLMTCVAGPGSGRPPSAANTTCRAGTPSWNRPRSCFRTPASAPLRRSSPSSAPAGN